LRIAIVGTGAAGLGAAWLLADRHDITVYERSPRLGGHCHTVTVPTDGGDIAVDTGFIVYNEHNYPNLTAMFRELAVPTQASDMSFAVSIGEGAFEYAGSLTGFFGQPATAFSAEWRRVLREILRFNREAPRLLEIRGGSDLTLGDYLRLGGYSDAFAERYLLPMSAAIWSAPMREMLAFPARSFIRFFANHGLLQLSGRPRWRTVSGGSREYVGRITAGFADRVRLNCGAAEIRRDEHGVEIRDTRGQRDRFDQVVIAAHADESLGMLGDADDQERRILGAFRYQPNDTLLHTDATLMPRRKRLWSSWNYIASRPDLDAHISVTYWMNRLQALPEAAPLFVSLNPERMPAADSIVKRMTYMHPVFDAGAIAAQRELARLQGVRRTWFCGSYCGFGFHEDAFAAGLDVAECLGARRPWKRAERPLGAPETTPLPAPVPTPALSRVAAE
jgi:predicted NAD/FAD-binding protein